MLFFFFLDNNVFRWRIELSSVFKLSAKKKKKKGKKALKLVIILTLETSYYSLRGSETDFVSKNIYIEYKKNDD